MNYNKLFLISFSLIYSANTFSNTDGLPPTRGNSIESIQEINVLDKKKKYMERIAHSLLGSESSPSLTGSYSHYVQALRQPWQVKRDSTDIQFRIAAPIFDEMIALFSKNSDSTDLKTQGSSILNIKEYSIEQQSNMLRYLWGERIRVLDLSKKAKTGDDRNDLVTLGNSINWLMEHLQENIDTQNNVSREVTIIRDDKIKEPLYDFFLKRNPADLSDLADMAMSFDDSLSRLDSTLNQTRTDLDKTREELNELDETVQQHEETIEEQEQEIAQVKETADNNKRYVDKFLANNFDINQQSNSLAGHLGSLYTGNKSNTDNINAIRNDLSHFKNETNNRFYKVEKRANQGIASVAAMSNLPFNDAATFSTAMGIGNYRNATAFAWGMQYRINENVKVKASTAWNDANNWVSAGGIGISW